MSDTALDTRPHLEHERRDDTGSQQIRLGVYAKDKVSGFKGFVCARYRTYSGMVQWGLQPHNEAGDKIIDPMSFDEHLLEFIDKGYSAQCSTPILSQFNLGETVRDKVSGFKGVVVSEIVFMNGCAHYQVQNKSSRLSEIFGWGSATKKFEWQRLELVETANTLAAVTRKASKATPAAAAAAPVAATAETAKPPGGPSINLRSL